MVRLKKDGHLIHQESKTFSTEALALSWGNRLEDRLKDTGVAARRKELKLFGEYLNEYREVRSGIKQLTRSMGSELDLLTRLMQSEKLSGLTSETFTRFAAQRRKSGAGPVTIQHNLATLRAALNAARPMFGIDIDGKVVAEALKSLGAIGAVSSSDKRTRTPSADELASLVAEFKRIEAYPSTFIPMSVFVPLAIALPRRMGELCAMRWSDLDKKNRTVLLRNTKNPSRVRDELIPVPTEAMRILTQLPVFDERILPYKADSVSASFTRACERLKIVDLHFHDLRREGISRLFEHGLGIPEVSLISGHMSWDMLKIYTKIKPANVLQKLDAHSQETSQAGS
jgi:integrase